jgi:hypothetical protein
MTRYSGFLVLFLIVCHTTAWSQSGTTVFDNSKLHEIRLTFTQNNFWQILTDNYNQGSVPGGSEEGVAYLDAAMTFDGISIGKVGVRQKGFSSHFFVQGNKKSLKIDFNEFQPDFKFDGLRKLNINNGVGDPSFQRDFLCYHMIRQMGAPAPRVAYAKIYLNDEYWGLYTLVEQVDKSFLSEHFADNDGNLYKNMANTTLKWNGTRKEDYPELEKKTNETGSWEDIIDLIRIINLDQNEFMQELPEKFNIKDYLRITAIDVITSNWDSYLEHGRNFYLYADSTNKKFHWIPWDYNLAMGGTFQAEVPMLPGETSCNFRSVILKRLINNNNRVEVSLFTNAQSPTITSYFWYVDGTPVSTKAKDTLDFGFNGFLNVELKLNYLSPDGKTCSLTIQEFINNFFNPLDCNSLSDPSFNHDKNDPVIQEILTSNPECCFGGWSNECEQAYINFDGRGTFGSNVPDFPVYPELPEKLLVYKLMQDPATLEQYQKEVCKAYNTLFKEEVLVPYMEHNAALIKDAVLSDPNYLFTPLHFLYDISVGNGSTNLPAIREFIAGRRDQVAVQIEKKGLECSAVAVEDIAWHEVTVNEIAAANVDGSGLTDEAGQYEDWIELYNNTNRDINLQGYYLTDDPARLNKWAFPDNTVIKSGSYLIVWADEDQDDGPLHSNFKLSKSGESVYLSNGSTRMVDTLTFGAQQDNKSYSRIPNGTGPFTIKAFTFNASNDGSTAAKDQEEIPVSIAPNPAQQFIDLTWNGNPSESALLRIQNAQGIVLLQQNIREKQQRINLSGLPAGMYFLSLQQGSRTSKVEKFILQP